MVEDELDALLAKLKYSVHNRQITEKEWSTQVYFDITNEFKAAINAYTTNKIIEAKIEETKLWKAGFKAATEKYSDDELVVSVAQKLYETADDRIAELRKTL